MLRLLYFIIEGNRKKSKSRFWASFILLFRVAIQNPLQPFPPRKPAEAFKRFLALSPNGSRKSNIHKEQSNNRLFVGIRKGSCRTVFFAQQLFPFFCSTSRTRRWFRSALFRTRRGSFLPAVFVAAVPPGFSGNGCLFCRKGVLWPGKSAEMQFRPFILPFLTVFTMFFIKKTLQMNFKNLLYNYKFNFFTQTFSYRFVWGSWVCAFRTASALR